MMNLGADYLSKSSVSSPIAYTRSPVKYGVAESKNDNSPFLQKSTASTTRKQWNTDYDRVKRVPDGISNLRQTFDTRTNARLAQRFAKYDFDNEDSGKEKFDSTMRSTFNGKISSPNNRDLTSSAAFDRGSYRKEERFDYPRQNYDAFPRSPISDSKGDRNDDKLKKYTEAVERFKDQLETSNKMSEQLKRLKQDRKRRLQAREKQKQMLVPKKDNLQSPSNSQSDEIDENFKKKNYYEYYTPKYEKSKVQDRFTKEKTHLNTLNLDRYKTKYDPREEVNSATYKSKAEVEITSPKSTKMNLQMSTPSPMRKKSQDVSGMLGGKPSILDFNLGKNLGEGKFGVVYQAVHKKSGWLFALKKVPKEMIKSHLMIDQFILELKLQTFLDHENILTLYASFDDKTHVYLVLEYMEEGTLFTHFKKNKTLPEAEVSKKMRQIASAIKYMHEHEIAHRDIKPENIVMSHGVCKLCDFGWSTVCNDRRQTYCGTFDYAPPEILEGVQYDQTVDLWCLGVLTYELLVGKAPFYHISRKETMKKILNVEKTNITYPQNLSKDAISFIDNLIRKDPKDRMGSDKILEHPFLKHAEEKF